MLEIIKLISNVGITFAIVGSMGSVLFGVPYSILGEKRTTPLKVSAIEILRRSMRLSMWVIIAGGIIVVFAILLFAMVLVWK